MEKNQGRRSLRIIAEAINQVENSIIKRERPGALETSVAQKKPEEGQVTGHGENQMVHIAVGHIVGFGFPVRGGQPGIFVGRSGSLLINEGVALLNEKEFVNRQCIQLKQ